MQLFSNSSVIMLEYNVLTYVLYKKFLDLTLKAAWRQWKPLEVSTLADRLLSNNLKYFGISLRKKTTFAFSSFECSQKNICSWEFDFSGCNAWFYLILLKQESVWKYPWFKKKSGEMKSLTSISFVVKLSWIEWHYAIQIHVRSVVNYKKSSR